MALRPIAGHHSPVLFTIFWRYTCVSCITNIRLNQRNETPKTHIDCTLEHDVTLAFGTCEIV